MPRKHESTLAGVAEAADARRGRVVARIFTQTAIFLAISTRLVSDGDGVGRRATQSATARWKNPTVRARRLTPRWISAVLLIGLVASTAPDAFADGTREHETLAEESICALWGFGGKIRGLCNAYCEAMDCDADEPQASDAACARTLGEIEAALGETPFPSCEDADGDSVPDGLDNCPDDPNADQADENPSTPEGDACEPVECLCATQWENEMGAADIRTLVDMGFACSAFSRPDFVTARFNTPNPLAYLVYSVSAGAFSPSTGSCEDAWIFDRGGNFENITIERAVVPDDLTACRIYLSQQGCDFGDP